MGLFKKNPNEVAYHEGKKHFMDVIKNTGPSDALIWRQPEEDFNTNSTLIVMPGEQAMFIKGGTIEQVFENGTYKLSTQNYPFISRLRNALTGGISTFNCVVYYVKTAHSMEIRWGTDSPIQVRDKLLGVATKLRCRGSYKVGIDNPVKFLEKLVGNNVRMQEAEDLSDYFINEFQSKIKSVIARAVNESNAELLGIDSRLDEFSDTIQPFMQETLENYGLRCVKFVVSAIDIDDDELRRKYDEIGMDAIAVMRMAQANATATATKAQGDKAAQDILGAGWEKQQSMEIMREFVKNDTAGGMGMMGAGLGMGFAAGGMFNGLSQQAFAPMAPGAQPQYGQPAQPQYGQPAQPQYGQPAAPAAPAPAAEDPVEKLGKLKKLLDAGLIEQAEFDTKKAEILSQL